jgi:cytolysin (calcineurin-like family phosphatase)
LRKTHEGSLAYSWDIGNVHFVQMHNYPIYAREWSNFIGSKTKRYIVKIKSSLNWLKNDLAVARNAGKVIILNYHDSDEHWLDAYKEDSKTGEALCNDFTKILTDYQVSAVFVGHYHESIGKNSVSSRFLQYGKVPVFYCGSASQSKYLLVHFKGNQMTVEKVSSLNGGTDRTADGTYPLDAKKAVIAVPSKDGRVTFFNEAGYVARYTLSYVVNGQSKSFSTGNLALGNK